MTKSILDGPRPWRPYLGDRSRGGPGREGLRPDTGGEEGQGKGKGADKGKGRAGPQHRLMAVAAGIVAANIGASIAGFILVSLVMILGMIYKQRSRRSRTYSPANSRRTTNTDRSAPLLNTGNSDSKLIGKPDFPGSQTQYAASLTGSSQRDDGYITEMSQHTSYNRSNELVNHLQQNLSKSHQNNNNANMSNNNNNNGIIELAPPVSQDPNPMDLPPSLRQDHPSGIRRISYEDPSASAITFEGNLSQASGNQTARSLQLRNYLNRLLENQEAIDDLLQNTTNRGEDQNTNDENNNDNNRAGRYR